MGEYEPKIEVQFPEVVPVAKSSTVKLECFALGKYVPLCIIRPYLHNFCLLHQSKLHSNVQNTVQWFFRVDGFVF